MNVPATNDPLTVRLHPFDVLELFLLISAAFAFKCKAFFDAQVIRMYRKFTLTSHVASSSCQGIKDVVKQSAILFTRFSDSLFFMNVSLCDLLFTRYFVTGLGNNQRHAQYKTGHCEQKQQFCLTSRYI